jgi:hypothetical protein
MFPGSENNPPPSITTRGSTAKNGISIESLINKPGPSTTPSEVALGKRKFSDIEENDDMINNALYMHSRGSSPANEPAQVEQKVEVVTEVVEVLATDTPQVATKTVPTPAAQEPPRKRSRLGDVAFGLTFFVAGGISAVGALASLPETLFS